MWISHGKAYVLLATASKASLFCDLHMPSPPPPTPHTRITEEDGTVVVYRCYRTEMEIAGSLRAAVSRCNLPEEKPAPAFNQGHAGPRLCSGRGCLLFASCRHSKRKFVAGRPAGGCFCRRTEDHSNIAVHSRLVGHSRREPKEREGKREGGQSGFCFCSFLPEVPSPASSSTCSKISWSPPPSTSSLPVAPSSVRSRGTVSSQVGEILEHRQRGNAQSLHGQLVCDQRAPHRSGTKGDSIPSSFS